MKKLLFASILSLVITSNVFAMVESYHCTVYSQGISGVFSKDLSLILKPTVKKSLYVSKDKKSSLHTIKCSI